MKLSSLEENSLRCLVVLAHTYKNKTTTTIREISVSQSMSIAYVGKVMGLLNKANLVSSTRGVQGGYTLTRQPEDITLAQIFHAANDGHEKSLSELHFSNPDSESMEGNCTVVGVWSQLSRHINEFLESVTLWTLAAGPGRTVRELEKLI